MVHVNCCDLSSPLLLFLCLKVSDRAEHLGSGLLHKGLKPNPDTLIGIFAPNRPEVSEVCGGGGVVFWKVVLFCLAPTCRNSISRFRSQWIIAELACYTYSMVAVPLYDTLGPEALVFIIDQGNWSLSCIQMLLITEQSMTPFTPQSPQGSVLCALIS